MIVVQIIVTMIKKKFTKPSELPQISIGKTCLVTSLLLTYYHDCSTSYHNFGKNYSFISTERHKFQ